MAQKVKNQIANHCTGSNNNRCNTPKHSHNIGHTAIDLSTLYIFYRNLQKIYVYFHGY